MERRVGSSLPLLIFLLTWHSLRTSAVEDQLRERRRVVELPGQDFNPSFAHYTGYITVHPQTQRTLFFWFIEAAQDPSSKPLLLWLNGGPGCSSIGFGEAEEIGPFHIRPDGRTLFLNPYSWNQVANVIFLESPVGAGFSYSNVSNDAANNGDRRTAKDSFVFLRKWFEIYPEYKGRNFYIAGESYAGHYAPQLAREIVRSKNSYGEDLINLKGYLVGNALTDDYSDHVGVFQYLWANGMISDETFKLLNVHCDFVSFISPSPRCEQMVELASEEMGNIDEYSILTPPCTYKSSSMNRLLNKLNLMGRPDDSSAYDPCIEKRVAAYFNSPEVQRALHVDPAVAPAEWLVCNNEIEDNWKDSERSILPTIHEFIDAGLRIWMFSGNADGILPITSTRHDLNALNLPKKGPWSAWYDSSEVAGWTQEYEGLTFVAIKGAGHQVPLLKPKLCLRMFQAFLNGSSMPKLPLLDVF